MALRRWRLLALTIAIACARIVAAVAAWAADAEGLTGHPAWAGVTAAADAVTCAGVIITVIAFVQYGRIFNPRIPTE